MIFACLFCAFYFMQVTQSLMAFWITTMLALLYGLLGQFSFDVLLVRIEETAIGAVIGVAVAILVLPTNIGTVLRKDTRDFLAELSALIQTSIATMFDHDLPESPTEQARATRPQAATGPGHRQAVVGGRRGFGGPAQHSAQAETVPRLRPLRPNPGPTQRAVPESGLPP